MMTFHGTTYRYRTLGEDEREIGVLQGLGGSWIVGYESTPGGGHHRIRSRLLPAGNDPAALQTALDQWARAHELEVLHQVAPPSAPAAAVRQPEGSGESTTPRPPEALPLLPSLPSLPVIPEGWDAKAALVDQCVAAGQRLSLWIAVIVTRAREDFADPGEWVSQCTERWGWAKGHLHHMHAVGSLLLRVSPGTLTSLVDLHWEKLYCISRLPPNLVCPFLEKAQPASATRDQVRAAVNRWLAAAGEPAEAGASHPSHPSPTSQSGTPTQPDFLDILFAPPGPGEDILAFHQQAVERAAGVADPLAPLMRAFTVLDALVPRIDPRRVDLMADLARDFRKQAERLDDLIRAGGQAALQP